MWELETKEQALKLKGEEKFSFKFEFYSFVRSEQYLPIAVWSSIYKKLDYMVFIILTNIILNFRNIDKTANYWLLQLRLIVPQDLSI